MDAIVYTSNTGFTEKYAKMLGGKLFLPVYSLEEAKGTQKILESKSGEGTETQPSGSEADQDGQRAGQNPGHTAGTSENSGTGVTGLWEKAKGAFGSAKETVTGAVENVTLSSEELLQKIEHSLSRFVEAIAVLLITSCVIPILVLLVFFWLIKVFLDLDMSGSLVKIRS